MITRLSGQLEHLDDHAAVLRVGGEGLDVGLEVLLPGFVARELAGRVGQRVVLHTLMYLESQNQGASFTPRLIGFTSPSQRAFFELFTTVKGIGNRRALRSLAEPVGVVAGAIENGDTKVLTGLPEIGRRMAETVIAELKGKVAAFAVDAADTDRPARPLRARGSAGSGSALSGSGLEAVEALVRLGQSRAEAERQVERATADLGREADPGAILARVLGS
jgi:Holliday junction DNA helicase RuvA